MAHRVRQEAAPVAGYLLTLGFRMLQDCFKPADYGKSHASEWKRAGVLRHPDGVLEDLHIEVDKEAVWVETS